MPVPLQVVLLASVKRFDECFFPFPPLDDLVQRCGENQTLCLKGNQRGNQTQKMPLALPSSLHHIILLKVPTLYLRRTNLLMLLTDYICYQCPLPILTARLITQKKELHFLSKRETYFFLPPPPPAPLHLLNLQNTLGFFWEKSST